jgi:hypothetical protein
MPSPASAGVSEPLTINKNGIGCLVEEQTRSRRGKRRKEARRLPECAVGGGAGNLSSEVKDWRPFHTFPAPSARLMPPISPCSKRDGLGVVTAAPEANSLNRRKF